MINDERAHFDEWERRSAEIGPAIRLAFPITLMDQERLQALIENAARPLTPRGGILTRIYSRIFPSAWVDNELLDFLKLLREHDWTQIDWHHDWMVIPVLPDAAFAYCLPGILFWIVVDPDAAFEAIEGLVGYSLTRVLSGHGGSGSSPHLFNAEQRHVVAEVVRLLCDLSFADNPQMQKAASDIVLILDDVEDNEA